MNEWDTSLPSTNLDDIYFLPTNKKGCTAEPYSLIELIVCIVYAFLFLRRTSPPMARRESVQGSGITIISAVPA